MMMMIVLFSPILLYLQQRTLSVPPLPEFTLLLYCICTSVWQLSSYQHCAFNGKENSERHGGQGMSPTGPLISFVPVTVSTTITDATTTSTTAATTQLSMLNFSRTLLQL